MKRTEKAAIATCLAIILYYVTPAASLMGILDWVAYVIAGVSLVLFVMA